MTQPPPPPPSPYGPEGPDPAGGTPPAPPHPSPYGASSPSPYQAPYQTPYGANPYGGPPPGPSPYDERPPASKALGGWALGLAIAFCVPLATLVSIGLAIAALVQSRDGRDRGKGMAVAALVIDALVVLGIAAAVVIALLAAPGEPQRDAEGRVTERHPISTFDVRVGDCLDDPALMAAGEESIEVKQAEAVPCDEPHDLEAYHQFDLQGADYPGRRPVLRQATLGCLRAFEPFVGRGYRASDAEFWSYFPQERSWKLLDDRTVVCLVGVPQEKTTGTLEGSNR